MAEFVKTDSTKTATGDKSVAAPADTTETKHDPFEKERMGAGASEKVEQPRESATAPKEDWTVHFDAIAVNRKLIDELKGKDGPVAYKDKMVDAKLLRMELVAETDQRFQLAIGGSMKAGEHSDMRILTKTLQVDELAKQKEALGKDPEVVQTLTSLGLHEKKSLTSDDLLNIDLNATESARDKITQLVALQDMEMMAKESAGQAYVTRKATEYLAVNYAKFLVDNKDVTMGVTLDGQGNPIHAKDILLEARNANLSATPEFKEQAARAGEQQIANQKDLLGIPHAENPAVLLAAGIKGGDVSLIQKAYDQAHTEKFDPAKLQEQIDKLSKEEKTTENLAKLNSLEEFKSIRAITSGFLGASLLQQPNPDFKKVLDLLDKAAADPKAAKMIQNDRGQPMLQTLYQETLMRQSPNFDKSRVEFAGQIQTMTEKSQAAVERAKAGGEGALDGPEMKEAIRAGQNAVATADSMIKALGPNGPKLEQQYRDLFKKTERTPDEQLLMEQLKPMSDIMHSKTEAMMMLATLDKMSGDNDSAKHLFDQVAKDRGFFELRGNEVRTQFNDQKNAIQAVYDYDHASWGERRWEDLKALPGKAWDWIKDNGKWVAFGVACVAGIALTAVSMGTLGAPVAIALGTIGGGLIGTAAGATVEVAGGKQEASLSGFWKAAVDVAPMAFTGSSIGALTMGTMAAPAAGAGGGVVALEGTAVVGTEAVAVANTARAAGVLSRFATGQPMQVFASAGKFAPIARTTTIGAISGVPYAYGDARDNNTGFGGFAKTYSSWVATSALPGMSLKYAIPAAAAKNTLFTALDGDSNGVGSFATTVALKTSADTLGRVFLGGEKWRPVTNSFYPIMAETGKGNIDAVDGIIQHELFGNLTHKLDPTLRSMGMDEATIKAHHDAKARAEGKPVEAVPIQPAPVEPAKETKAPVDATAPAPRPVDSGKPGEGPKTPAAEQKEAVPAEHNAVSIDATNIQTQDGQPVFLATLQNGSKVYVLGSGQVVGYPKEQKAAPQSGAGPALVPQTTPQGAPSTGDPLSPDSYNSLFKKK